MMKSNNAKKDFLSYLKPIFITILIVVLSSAVVFGIFGFNKGFDFTGGTQLVVEVSSYNTDEPQGMTEELNNTANEISNILKKNGISINSFQVQGEYTYKSFVITFKDVKTSKLNSIRMEINEKFNKSTSFSELDDAYDITKNTSHIDGFLQDNIVLTTVSTLLFAIVICMVYALFRVKVAGSLTVVLSGILSVVLTCAFVLLTRIEINTYFFVALGVVELYSLFLTTDMLFKTKAKLKDSMLTDKNNYELANIVLEENLSKNIVVGVFSVAVALIVGLLGVVNVLKLSLVVLVGLVVAFCLNLFVLPAVWVKLSKKRELARPIKTETNDKDDSAEVVEVTEIDQKDDDAEVVEVKE